MRIGFISAGSVTKTFGRHLINAGHEIIVSDSSGLETLKTLTGLVADLGPGATAGTKAQGLNRCRHPRHELGGRARGTKRISIGLGGS